MEYIIFIGIVAMLLIGIFIIALKFIKLRKSYKTLLKDLAKKESHLVLLENYIYTQRHGNDE